MLRLSKKADYGLIALTHLAARRRGGTASAKEIADAYGIPLPLLSKVLQKLARRGFLDSIQGVNGGYKLARQADTISALEVIRVIDGPIVLTRCRASRSRCYQSEKCTVREPLRTVHEGIVELLAGIKISDMSKKRGQPGVRPLTVLQT